VRASRERRADAPVYSVTSVRRGLSEDVHDRAVRYVVSMLVRTGCFVGMAFVDGWARWLLAAGAVLLPYIAVVLANAGRERPEPPTATLGPVVALPALEAGPGAAARARTSHPPRVVLPDGGYLR
jgi:hypothetical protein